MSKIGKRLITLIALFALSLLGSAAEINSPALGLNGWYADDIRADDAVPFPLGTNLISASLTDLPEQSSAVAGHTTEILEQIQFGAAFGAFPFGTHPGSVRLFIDPVNTGKSQISHRKTDLTGHAPGTAIADPGFFVSYSWMGTAPTPDQLTAGFKIGFKTSEFGLAPVSSRTGENAWDKLLIYEPYYSGNSADGNWHTETISRTSGVWWFVDRAATVSGPDFLTRTIAQMETSTDRYGGNVANHTYAELYSLITSGIITSIQFGIGSGVSNVDLYINQLSTSFYRMGDVTTFGPGYRVHNVTQLTDFVTIQSAIDAANPSDHIVCDAGIYVEDVMVNKAITLTGAGIDASVIRGIPGGDNAAVRMAAVGSILEGFTITRLGNNVIDWNDTALNSAGVAIQSTGGAIVRNNKFVGNRTGIDINNAGSNQVLNNAIDFNRTGMILRNLCPNNLIEENLITNNWTAGLLYLGNAGAGADLTGTLVSNNSLSGNWYTQLEGREINPGAYLWNASGNWLGSAALTTANTNGTEPGYSAQIPVAYGGSAVDPGGAVSVRGVGLNYIDYTPWLSVGTDTNVETTMGRGIVGFQGNFTSLWVDDLVSQTTNVIQEAVNMVSGSTINLSTGTYAGQVHATGFANLNIIGSGVGNTFIKAPLTAMSDFFTTSANNYPVLFLDNSTVNVSNLTVDGDGKGNINNRFHGIAFWNSGGSLTNVDIVHVRDNPFSGAQHCVGLTVNNNNGGPYDVNLTNINVTDYQKNGTVFTSTGTNVDCDDVTIIGQGPTSVTAQNGMQYSYGAGGTVTNSTVSDICWTGGYWTATGILLYQGTTVAVNNTDVLNQQTGVYFQDTGGSFANGDVTASNAADSTNGIYVYSQSAALAIAPVRPQVYEDGIVVDERRGSLDDNETVSINNAQVIGTGSAESYGVVAYSAGGGDLTVSVTNSNVSYWNYGIDYTAGSGTISSGTVTGTTLINTVNTYDNTSGHTWNNNCYSDFTGNANFPVSYLVAGLGANLDLNPNPNGCSDVNFVVSDNLIGCSGSCNTTLLYITLDAAALPNLQVVFTLPTGFSTTGGTVTPPPLNRDPNLLNAYASVSGQVVTLDMGFQSPGSTGDNTKYVACFTLTNTGAGTGVHTVAGNTTLWVDGLGGNHINELMLGTIDITVDCTPPAAPATFVNNGTCAYGVGNMPANSFAVTGLTASGGAALQTVWLTANGNASPTYPITLSGADPYSFTFPTPGTEAAFYDLIDDVNGCNTLNLHVTDAECNTAVYNLTNVGWDATAPSLSVATSIPLNYCFNNNSLTTNYGGAYLDDYIDITSLLGANPCMAASGTLTISHAGLADYVVALDKTNYPSDNTEALALWTWMLGLPAIANSNGSSFTFDVKAADCAGNLSSTLQFTICVDTDTPDNSVTAFDARPAHLGVWLKWSWTAGPDAQEMRIYRSPLSGEYPSYPSDLWNSNANYDVSQIDPIGWALVATQTALTGTITSGTYGANNNRGDFHTHLSGGTYWLDAETGWVDGNGNAAAYRDIYRYVTFVKDAGGNWSVGAPVSMTANADRSTNYWLGDFSTADGTGLPGSRGRVDSDDLGLLSPVYFTNTGGYRNIGPVAVENGNIGKGIPDPDGLGAINFSDLVPFSFNYGMVGPVTNPLEFVIEPGVADVRPFNRLDEMPSVSIGMDSEIQLTEGTEFTVTVTMSGNEGNAVKAAEAILEFNPSLLDFVSATMGNVAAPEGTMFSKASLIEGVNGQVGFVAASCGGWSTLEGSAVLGTVTFRIKSDINAACNISLSSVKLLDNSGEVVEPEGNVISVLNAAALPDNYALYQNYPNPFNPTTNIQFDLKESGHVKIQVFNTLGQMVTTVVDRDMVAGRHDVTFDASSMASGLYMYSISVNGFSDLKKMVLIR